MNGAGRLVTGSSRGLGRAIVEAGLAAGNKVLATARGIESLADLSERYGIRSSSSRWMLPTKQQQQTR